MASAMKETPVQCITLAPLRLSLFRSFPPPLSPTQKGLSDSHDHTAYSGFSLELKQPTRDRSNVFFSAHRLNFTGVLSGILIMMAAIYIVINSSVMSVGTQTSVMERDDDKPETFLIQGRI